MPTVRESTCKIFMAHVSNAEASLSKGKLVAFLTFIEQELNALYYQQQQQEQEFFSDLSSFRGHIENIPELKIGEMKKKGINFVICTGTRIKF